MFKTPHKGSLHHSQQQSHQSSAARSANPPNLSSLRSGMAAGASVNTFKAPSTPTAATTTLNSSTLRFTSHQNRVAGGLASAAASPLLPSKSLLQLGTFSQQQQPNEFFIHSSLYTIARISSIPSHSQQQPYTANSVVMDPASGFIAECNSAHIYVWNAKNSIIPPSKLPIPLFERGASSVQVPNALACLVSGTGNTSSVGLIAVNAAGLIRAWPSVEVPKQFEEVDAQLGQHVCPIFLARIDNLSFLLGLDNGMALQILVSETLSFSFLKRSSLQRSIFGYITGSLTPSSATSSAASAASSSILNSSSERLLGALPGNSHNKNELHSTSFYISSNKSLQKWVLRDVTGGGLGFVETFQWEIDLVSLVTSHLQLHASIRDAQIIAVAVGPEKLSSERKSVVFLLKARFRSDPPCYFLVSVKENDNEDGFDLISCKKLKADVSEASVTGLVAVSSSSVSPSPIALISFPEKLIIVSVNEDVDLEEVVTFKTKDLLALGGQDQFNMAAIEQQVSAFLYCSSSGILELKLPVSRLKPEMQQIFADAPAMKSDIMAKLEQIVFFNSSAEPANPIALKIELRSSEVDLNKPAIELSTSICNGSHPQLPNVFDETTFLNETFHRSHEIIVALSKNDLVEKLSELTRLKLLFNAEKVAVMRELWNYQNSIYMKGTSDQVCFGFLQDAITLFIQKRSNLGMSSVRDFFRTGAPHLSDFLLSTQTLLFEIINQRQSGGSDLLIVREGCRILNIVYETALAYRFETRSLYQYDDTTFSLEPWTASFDMLSILQRQFEITIKSIDKLRSISGLAAAHDMGSFYQGFFSLCNHVLGSIRDAKSNLLQVRASQRQIDGLTEKYRSLLEQANSALLRFDMEDQAFLLAETFEEFETLVRLTLSNKSKDYRIKSYIERFDRKFAMILYQCLLDKNMKRELLELDSVNSALLDEFLQKEDLKDLMWIQDVKHKRYQQASANLWELAQAERGMKEQSLALALSKLNYLATIKYEDLETENAISSLEIFEKAQDLIEFHGVLINYIKDTIVGADDGLEGDLDATLAAVMSRCFESIPASSLQGRIVKSSNYELLRDRKISVIGILDVVTLMSVPSDELYVDVLKLLNNKIESGEFFHHLVWKRAWLSDDWRALHQEAQNKSDEDMKERVRETTVMGLFEASNLSEGTIPVIGPLQIRLEIPSNLNVHYPSLSAQEVEELKAELSREHERFLALAKDVDLVKFWNLQ